MSIASAIAANSASSSSTASTYTSNGLASTRSFVSVVPPPISAQHVSSSTYIYALLSYLTLHHSDLTLGTARLTLTLSGLTLLHQRRLELKQRLSRPTESERQEVKEVNGVDVESMQRLYAMLATLRHLRIESSSQELRLDRQQPYFKYGVPSDSLPAASSSSAAAIAAESSTATAAAVPSTATLPGHDRSPLFATPKKSIAAAHSSSDHSTMELHPHEIGRIGYSSSFLSPPPVVTSRLDTPPPSNDSAASQSQPTATYLIDFSLFPFLINLELRSLTSPSTLAFLHFNRMKFQLEKFVVREWWMTGLQKLIEWKEGNDENDEEDEDNGSDDDDSSSHLRRDNILSDWSSLRFLSIRSSLQRFDQSFRYLPHVEILDLSCNRIESFEVVSSNNTTVTTASSKNELIISPASASSSTSTTAASSPPLLRLSDMSSLSYLDLGYNLLSSLPSSFHLIIGNLQTLILRNNKLASLGTSLQACYSLLRLDLSYNLFSSFSDILSGLSTLPILEYLWLYGNPITFIRGYRSAVLAGLYKSRLRSVAKMREESEKLARANGTSGVSNEAQQGEIFVFDDISVSPAELLLAGKMHELYQSSEWEGHAQLMKLFTMKDVEGIDTSLNQANIPSAISSSISPVQSPSPSLRTASDSSEREEQARIAANVMLQNVNAGSSIPTAIDTSSTTASASTSPSPLLSSTSSPSITSTMVYPTSSATPLRPKPTRNSNSRSPISTSSQSSSQRSQYSQTSLLTRWITSALYQLSQSPLQQQLQATKKNQVRNRTKHAIKGSRVVKIGDEQETDEARSDSVESETMSLSLSPLSSLPPPELMQSSHSILSQHPAFPASSVSSAASTAASASIPHHIRHLHATLDLSSFLTKLSSIRERGGEEWLNIYKEYQKESMMNEMESKRQKVIQEEEEEKNEHEAVAAGGRKRGDSGAASGTRTPKTRSRRSSHAAPIAASSTAATNGTTAAVLQSPSARARPPASHKSQIDTSISYSSRRLKEEEAWRRQQAAAMTLDDGVERKKSSASRTPSKTPILSKTPVPPSKTSVPDNAIHVVIVDPTDLNGKVSQLVHTLRVEEWRELLKVFDTNRTILKEQQRQQLLPSLADSTNSVPSLSSSLVLTSPDTSLDALLTHSAYLVARITSSQQHYHHNQHYPQRYLRFTDSCMEELDLMTQHTCYGAETAVAVHVEMIKSEVDDDEAEKSMTVRVYLASMTKVKNDSDASAGQNKTNVLTIDTTSPSSDISASPTRTNDDSSTIYTLSGFLTYRCSSSSEASELHAFISASSSLSSETAEISELDQSILEMQQRVEQLKRERRESFDDDEQERSEEEDRKRLQQAHDLNEKKFMFVFAVPSSLDLLSEVELSSIPKSISVPTRILNVIPVATNGDSSSANFATPQRKSRSASPNRRSAAAGSSRRPAASRLLSSLFTPSSRQPGESRSRSNSPSNPGANVAPTPSGLTRLLQEISAKLDTIGAPTPQSALPRNTTYDAILHDFYNELVTGTRKQGSKVKAWWNVSLLLHPLSKLNVADGVGRPQATNGASNEESIFSFNNHSSSLALQPTSPPLSSIEPSYTDVILLLTSTHILFVSLTESAEQKSIRLEEAVKRSKEAAEKNGADAPAAESSNHNLAKALSFTMEEDEEEETDNTPALKSPTRSSRDPKTPTASVSTPIKKPVADARKALHKTYSSLLSTSASSSTPKSALAALLGSTPATVPQTPKSSSRAVETTNSSTASTTVASSFTPSKPLPVPPSGKTSSRGGSTIQSSEDDVETSEDDVSDAGDETSDVASTRQSRSRAPSKSLASSHANKLRFGDAPKLMQDDTSAPSKSTTTPLRIGRTKEVVVKDTTATNSPSLISMLMQLKNSNSNAAESSPDTTPAGSVVNPLTNTLSHARTGRSPSPLRSSLRKARKMLQAKTKHSSSSSKGKVSSRTKMQLANDHAQQTDEGEESDARVDKAPSRVAGSLPLPDLASELDSATAASLPPPPFHLLHHDSYINLSKVILGLGMQYIRFEYYSGDSNLLLIGSKHTTSTLLVTLQKLYVKHTKSQEGLTIENDDLMCLSALQSEVFRALTLGKLKPTVSEDQNLRSYEVIKLIKLELLGNGHHQHTQSTSNLLAIDGGTSVTSKDSLVLASSTTSSPFQPRFLSPTILTILLLNDTSIYIIEEFYTFTHTSCHAEKKREHAKVMKEQVREWGKVNEKQHLTKLAELMGGEASESSSSAPAAHQQRRYRIIAQEPISQLTQLDRTMTLTDAEAQCGATYIWPFSLSLTLTFGKRSGAFHRQFDMLPPQRQWTFRCSETTLQRLKSQLHMQIR